LIPRSSVLDCVIEGLRRCHEVNAENLMDVPVA
jgi:hypothetical protein